MDEAENMEHEHADMEAVAQMLKQAQKYGLPVEVIKAFGDHRKDGHSIQESAAMALYDWDI